MTKMALASLSLEFLLEIIMSFGEFHSKICTQLKIGHKWGDPIRFLGDRPELLTVVYDQYQLHKDDVDFRAVVETTCLKLDGLT